MRDPAKPALTGAGAWVGLAQPDPGGNWQFESKRYQYWTRTADEWHNPLEYVIGTSKPTRDWNYAQSSYPVRGGRPQPWKWSVHFQLDRAPTTDASLTLAFAAADGARLDGFANNENRPVATFSPSVQGGNALLRESIHAKYCVHRIPIPAANLHPGANTITLVQTRTQSPANHVMYDYLSLEAP